jgi:hypothetical protein
VKEQSMSTTYIEELRQKRAESVVDESTRRRADQGASRRRGHGRGRVSPVRRLRKGTIDQQAVGGGIEKRRVIAEARALAPQDEDEKSEDGKPQRKR